MEAVDTGLPMPRPLPAPDPLPLPPRWLAAIAAAVYAVGAIIWIELSEALLERWVTDPLALAHWQGFKSLLFVLVSAGLLYASLALLLRRNARLERRQDMLRALVDASPDVIYAKDRKGRYLLFNLAAEGVTGRPAADMVGRDDSSLFAPAQAEVIRANDQRVMAQGQPQSFEEALDTVDGRCVYMATKGPLFSGGQVSGMAAASPIHRGMVGIDCSSSMTR